MVIEKLLDVMYSDFIDYGTFKGIIKAPMVSGSYDYLKKHDFVPSGFNSVDELKDAQADAMKLDIGKTTQSDLLAEDGSTLERWLQTKAHERELYEQYKFIYEPEKTAPVVPPTTKATATDVEAQTAETIAGETTAKPNSETNLDIQ